MSDLAASGGYYLALAGDEIYADPSSIVGSIGVVFAGFGFDKAIEKLVKVSANLPAAPRNDGMRRVSRHAGPARGFRGIEGWGRS